MRFAVIGSAFSGNKGASAMLESSVQHLSRAGDGRNSFVLLSMYPRSDAEQNPYPNLRVLDASPARLGVLINGAALAHRLLPPLRKAIRRAVPEVRALAEADVLLDEGGITFVDGRGKFLIYNVASVLPALMVGTPVVKVAQALGPFKSPANKIAAKAILPRMAAIISRGAITHEHLMGLGLTNVHAGADLAFTLEVTDADAASAEAKADMAFFAGGDVVGFSPSAVLAKGSASRGEDYVAEVAAQIDHVAGVLSRPVFLVAHSARANTDKTHNNDLPLCRDILAAVTNKDKVLFIDDELSSQELRHLIGKCDVFVASRFHAMVSSLAMSVPTVVIGWSHKYREVLQMFGQERFAVGHTDLTEARFAELVDDVTRDRASIHEQIASALVNVKANAMEQIEVIAKIAQRG